MNKREVIRPPAGDKGMYGEMKRVSLRTIR